MVASTIRLKFHFTNSPISNFNYDHQLGPQIKEAITLIQIRKTILIEINHNDCAL